MKINLTETYEWNLKFKDIRDEFPDEYEMDKNDGDSDQDFVVRTIRELGVERFSDLFGMPIRSEIDVEVND